MTRINTSAGRAHASDYYSAHYFTGPEPSPATERAPVQAKLPELRQHDRVQTWQSVDLLGCHGVRPAELVDISRAGLKVRLANGFVPNVGEEVTVRLLDGSHLTGAIAWAGDDMLGISLHQPLADIEGLLSFEHMGDKFYRSLVDRQARHAEERR